VNVQALSLSLPGSYSGSLATGLSSVARGMFDPVVIGIIIVGLIGLTIEILMRLLEKRLIPWRGKGQLQQSWEPQRAPSVAPAPPRFRKIRNKSLRLLAIAARISLPWQMGELLCVMFLLAYLPLSSSCQQVRMLLRQDQSPVPGVAKVWSV